jgi:hypothetical protein
MATILDLFKSRKSELYGGTGPELFIDSKGVVNIPRQSALLVTSPPGVTGFIGNQIGGLLKGSAERPTDTIFRNNKPFSRTVSLSPGAVTGAKYAIEAGQNLYVKKDPGIPADSVIAGIQQGVTSPGSFIQQQAAKAIRSGEINKITKDIKTAGGINKAITNLIKRGELNPSKAAGTYNPGLMEDHKTGKVVSKDAIKFTMHAPKYAYTPDNGITAYKQIGLEQTQRGANTIDKIIENVLKGSSGYASFEDFEIANKGTDMVYVRFDVYKKGTSILLPAVISGISEDITPEWSDSKYLGSPFNLYRYGGVERSIKFSIKLYYVDHITKVSMIRKLDALRKLVFPDEDLASITYANTSNNSSQLAIKPNLVWLTISGLYEDLLGVIDSLSFSIDDSASWPSTISQQTTDNMNPDITISNNSNYEKPYPSVIDVSVSMKIIENPEIEVGTNGSSFLYKKKNVSYFTNYFEYSNTETANAIKSATESKIA